MSLCGHVFDLKQLYRFAKLDTDKAFNTILFYLLYVHCIHTYLSLVVNVEVNFTQQETNEININSL